MTNTLFPLPPERAPDLNAAREPAEPRLQRPDRRQVELRAVDLDGLLPADHRARIVWDFVEGLELTPLYGMIRAVEGHAGRPSIDPAILMALWLYATLEGVGSARAVARLCEAHDAYRWLCGGVSVNYHTLADFRVGHPEYLDQVLTTSVATLVAEGLVDLTRVTQDGVKVRASAGGGSFRRGARLRQALAAAEAQVAALQREVEADPGATARRQAAARQRAAEDRRARVARALAELPAVAARRQKARRRGEARVSTTDPEARVMKMADGGYRPAVNVQLAATPRSQVIVGVAVSNRGTDQGQLTPMVEQLQRRYRQAPAELLADGGYVALDDIRTLEAPPVGCRVYAPPAGSQDPTRAQRPLWRADDPVIAAWRARMRTPEAEALYKERAATSECVNALARNRGLRQLVVRGLRKARGVLLWFAIAHTLLRAVRLRQLALAR